MVVISLLAGIWNGAQVAVKIIEYVETAGQETKMLEGLLQEDVSHPNVVSVTAVVAWQML